MYTKILLLISLLFTFSQAKVFNAVAMIVEGEAVTTAEIQAVQSQLGISKSEAVDILIQDRLQKIAMKDITVPESDIDGKIAMIAKANNITIKKMQEVLKAQGTPWVQYRTSIRNAMKKEKFFALVVAKEIPDPSEDQLKLFYKINESKFVMPSTIKVTQYNAPTEEAMQNFLQTKTGLQGQAMSKSTQSLDSSLLQMMLSTPDGQFTRPINAGDKYIVYKVHNKSGRSKLDYENAKPAIANAWKQEQQTKALKDYFSKMRTGADIEYIRK